MFKILSVSLVGTWNYVFVHWHSLYFMKLVILTDFIMVRLLVFQINATFAIFLATFRGPTVFWNCGLKNSFSRTPFQTSYLFVMLELPCPQIYAMTSYKTKHCFSLWISLLLLLLLVGFTKCFTKIQRPKSKYSYFPKYF